MKTRGISTVAVLLALASPSLSSAQEPSEGPTPKSDADAQATPSASELAQQGKQAFDAGNWAEAIDYYQRAESLKHSPLNLLYWARAAEKLGQLVQARENFQAVLDDEPEGNADELAKLQQEAKTELDALEPRVPWVTIVVKGADIDTEVQVTVDGRPLMPGTLSVKQPINPGTHEFQTRSGDLVGKAVKATFAEGQEREVTLQLPVDNKPAPLVRREPSEPVPQMDEPAEPAFDDTLRPPEKDNSGLQLAGYTVLGVGVVGLGLGTVFGLQTSSKNDDIKTACGDVKHCPLEVEEDVKRMRDEAKGTGTVATIGFIVGGVGVAGGVTLLVLSMDRGSSSGADTGTQPRPSLSAWLGPQSLGLRGTF